MDLRDLERLGPRGERTPGRRRASIVLPAPGGPVEQEMVTARGGDLGRPTSDGLPRTLEKSGTHGPIAAVPPVGRGRDGLRAGNVGDRLAEVPRPE